MPAINVKTEVLAGVTTFLTSMYIIVVNPSILQNAGMPFDGVLTATVLVSAFTSIMMGIPKRWWGGTNLDSNVPLIRWQGLFAMPDFSLFLQFDLLGSLQLIMLPVVFTILFTDLFDSVSTLVGVMEAGDLRDSDGEPRNIKQSLIVDAIGTALSGLVGTSPTTSFIESATGIEEGGRSGLTAIVAGLLFLPFMFLAPLLSMIPAIATAPALVLVGAFMMRPILNIHWHQLDAD